MLPKMLYNRSSIGVPPTECDGIEKRRGRDGDVFLNKTPIDGPHAQPITRRLAYTLVRTLRGSVAPLLG